MSDVTVGRVEPLRCACGGDMLDGGSVGWYCKRGLKCSAPALIAPYKSDKDRRIADLEAERVMLQRIQRAAQAVVNDQCTDGSGHPEDVEELRNALDGYEYLMERKA